jgi:predicted AlkP superfamily pyrophosphatase or phosphodiesterase
MSRLSLVCVWVIASSGLLAPGLANAQAAWDFGPDTLLTGLPQERAAHVVLVSIDGLRPEFYLDRNWPAPTLQYLARNGLRANAVRPAFPSVTYPSHTTIVTGEPPAAHGIVHNRTREQPGPVARWYWHADSLRVPALWDRVREDGGTTASLWWPVTVGADIDWNLPVPPLPEDPDATRLDMLRDVVSPPALLEELERHATGRLTDTNFENGSRAKEDRLGSMAAYLIETYRPTLTLVHVVATDSDQHAYGREHPEVRRAVHRERAHLGVRVSQKGHQKRLFRLRFLNLNRSRLLHPILFFDNYLPISPWLSNIQRVGSSFE